MVDLGMVSLFTLQLAFVMACYHAWRGIKAEIVALIAERSALEALRGANAENARATAALMERVAAIEVGPKASTARIAEAEERMGRMERKTEAIETKVTSLGGRLSAFARHRPKVDQAEGEDDTEAAAQAEGSQVPMHMFPPPSQQTQGPEAAPVPPGFGVVRRRAG